MNESTAGGPAAVVIGAPGSGKTTVGRLVAERLGVDFRDTDDDVEATAGMAVSDIFIDRGEERFRELERAAVHTALAEHAGVVALGGGAVLDEGTQALLTGHTAVYLAVGAADAAKRVGIAQARPLIVGNPRARLKALLEERLPIYERLGTLTVQTDGREPDDIADEVVAALTVRGARS